MALALILVGVFWVGTQATYLGPYSDTLHLIILSSVIFFTFLVLLIFQALSRRRAR